MPIAGAPRTTMPRIASATSCQVTSRTSTTAAGSRVWSSSTTAPSSKRAIPWGRSAKERGGAITWASL